MYINVKKYVISIYQVNIFSFFDIFSLSVPAQTSTLGHLNPDTLYVSRSRVSHKRSFFFCFIRLLYKTYRRGFSTSLATLHVIFHSSRFAFVRYYTLAIKLFNHELARNNPARPQCCCRHASQLLSEKNSSRFSFRLPSRPVEQQNFSLARKTESGHKWSCFFFPES